MIAMFLSQLFVDVEKYGLCQLQTIRETSARYKKHARREKKEYARDNVKINYTRFAI